MSVPAPRRGEVWVAETEKRRPVVVLTRDPMGRYLHSVLVAPVTSRIRGLSTEVVVGPEQGFRIESAISLDNTRLIPRTQLRRKVTKLDPDTMNKVCDALAIAVGCR